jgi:hypothetical protein
MRLGWSGSGRLASTLACLMAMACATRAPSEVPPPRVAAPAPRLRVLFLGNSYTFVGDVPARVREIGLGLSPPVTIEIDSATEGGATLGTLYARPDVQEKLTGGHWSHVVIQEQSTETLRQPDDFRRSAGLIAARAHAGGAQPVLYETWARRDGDVVYKRPWSGGSPSAMQERIDALYLAEARETRSLLAPVGDARWRAMKDPTTAGIELFRPDGSHPTLAGAYLAACVLFRAITGRSPDGGGYPAELGADVARRLQAVSAAVSVTGP